MSSGLGLPSALKELKEDRSVNSMETNKYGCLNHDVCLDVERRCSPLCASFHSWLVKKSLREPVDGFKSRDKENKENVKKP